MNTTSRFLAAMTLVLVLSAPSQQAAARGAHHAASYCTACARALDGRIARSASAKRQFEVQTGHPHGWPGHVVDHVIALKRGGADDPRNMQWQTIEAAKAKDRIE